MASPANGQTFFVNATEEMGPDYLFPANITAAFGDYNNDGWVDYFTSQIWGPKIALLQNQEGRGFINRTTEIQAELPERWRGGGAFLGDIDNDGDLDLFVPTGRFSEEEAGLNVLLRNDRGIFTDITLESGLVDEFPTDNAIWLDHDRDGDLDLYTGNFFPGSNIFYRNNSGVFEDVTSEVGLAATLTDTEVLIGTNGGMAAADFDNDGWPDLYVAIWRDRNRLFLNDGQGHFEDATTGEIGDPGEAFGMAVGDIDNDGDLDLFQAATGIVGKNRSFLLQNFGEGDFLDITEGVGLLQVTSGFLLNGLLEDIDNDGDVDLMTTDYTDFDNPSHFLFLNEINEEGQPNFIDHSSQSTTGGIGGGSPVDVNGDGFLDLVSAQEFHRNRGNDHHWLGVELVGVESNRNGVGTRLTAVSGELRQIREIIAGTGFDQDVLSKHFGLGERTQVDQLEIRWPSGRVEMLENIPADRRIRVIEGSGAYYEVVPTEWTLAPPAALTPGEEVDLVAAVRPALFEPEAQITGVTANLRSLGGPADVPLADMGDGTYRLEARFTASGGGELREVSVLIEQSTSLGPYWIRLNRPVSIGDGASSVVLEDHSATAPQEFALDQNYPNPFNSSTLIRFALPQNGPVELALFNLAGQQVATLVEGPRKAGRYAINWDGRNDAGGNLASGVYFYRLQAGAQVQVNKLLLLQ